MNAPKEAGHTPDDGGPAFPSSNTPETGYYAEGMSLRDHFAGLAMQAAATNPVGADGFTFSERARWAYEQADAMIRARAGRSQ